MLLDQVINEMRSYGTSPNRRSAGEIYRLLDQKRQLFKGKLDPDNFRMLLQDFESLSNASAAEYNSGSFQRDYSKSYNLLMFYLEKII